MINYLLTSLMLLIGISAYSQKTGELVHVYLVGNNFLKGTLLEESNGESIRLELAKDSVMEVPMRLIDHIDQGKVNRFYNRRGQSARNEGIGIEVGFSSFSAKPLGFLDRDVRNSRSFHLSAHYYVKPYLSLGVGGSLDFYGDLVLPLYVHGRIFHPTKVYAPFASLQLGYIAASGNILGYDTLNEFEKMKGGLVFHPSIGIRLPLFGGTDLMFDVGYRVQRVTYEASYPEGWWIQHETTRITYKSLSVRAGILF